MINFNYISLPHRTARPNRKSKNDNKMLTVIGNIRKIYDLISSIFTLFLQIHCQWHSIPISNTQLRQPYENIALQ